MQSQTQGPVPTPAPPSNSAELFDRLEKYEWQNDPEFQSGLVAILGPDHSQLDSSRLRDLSLHARCFYFSRKFNETVDFESYKKWREQQPASKLASLDQSSTTSAQPQSAEDKQSDPEYPATFAEIMELIQSGKPIPGIKDIPNTVLEGQGTQPTRQERKKPWEKARDEGSSGGLFSSHPA